MNSSKEFQFLSKPETQEVSPKIKLEEMSAEVAPMTQRGQNEVTSPPNNDTNLNPVQDRRPDSQT